MNDRCAWRDRLCANAGMIALPSSSATRVDAPGAANIVKQLRLRIMVEREDGTRVTQQQFAAP
jgi:hypothetical protein